MGYRLWWLYAPVKFEYGALEWPCLDDLSLGFKSFSLFT